MKGTRAATGLLPIATLGLYAWYVRSVCCEFLDAQERYVLPAIGFAPEDVLGFGPWPIWCTVVIALLITCAVVYRWATRSPWYFAIIGLTFIALAATDWHYYKGLERAVFNK